jgi:membrane fusion protein, copper/silver efflux system
MKNRIGKSVLHFILPICFLAFLACKSKKQEQIKENEFYVCSMDPQVMEKQPGMCPICKMPLTKATIDTKQMQGIQINGEQAKLANIKVEPILQSSIGRSTTLNGVFAVNQNKTEQVSARIKGRIEQLYYKIIGTQVNKGDKLYALYSRELLQAQEEYLLAIEKGKLLKTGEQNFIMAARNKLVLWGLSEAQIVSLENTNQPKITNTIYSTVSGVITEIPLKEGDYVNEGTEVYKVADLSSIWVEAQLYTNELAYLQEGKVVEIIPAPYPDDRINALVLPIEAVIQNANNSLVWVQTHKNTFEPRMVTTGVQNDEKIEILSGLKGGDTVVTSGTYLLNSEYIFKRGMNPMENKKEETPINDMPNMKM